VSETADVVVIGGGVIGASTAFNLALNGVTDVTLVERDSIASGNSGRSSAIIRMHYTTPPLVQLAVYSLRVFQNFREIVGDESGFVPAGYVALVGDGDRPALEQNVGMQQEHGALTSVIEPDDLRQMMPGMYVDDLVGAAYEPECGYADPVLTTQGFANGARARGVSVQSNSAVRRILSDAQGVAGVETSRGVIQTRRVILCANVWTPGLLEPLGVQLPVTAIREEMTVFERPPAIQNHLAILDLAQLMYMRPEINGLTLVGNSDHNELPDRVEPDSAVDSVSPATVEKSVGKLVHRFPEMADGNVRRGYSGLYDVTPDLNPIFEETPISGLFVAVGFSGHGFKLSPAVGALMAELATKGTTGRVGVDAAIFSSKRYAEGRLIKGTHAYRQAALRY
jgi:glycine/D-amino acid oxidase-like deaminating enzyme